MSEAPPPPSPPPQASPDGKWWWDGQAWVPMPTQVSSGPQPAAQPYPQPQPFAAAPVAPQVTKQSHRGRNVILGCGGLIALFLVIAIIGALGSNNTSSSSAASSPSINPKPSVAAESPATSASASAPSSSSSPTPSAAATPSPVSVQQVVTFTNAPLTAAPGQNATLQAKTAPNTSCNIEVDYKSGASKAAGLVTKNSDAAGNVSWTWKVGASTTAGTWPITVTCGDGSAQTQITVT